MEAHDQNRGPSKRAGIADLVPTAKTDIQELYRRDLVPWVVGYSGGKDSTAVLQLIWLALAELPPEERRKPIHVISTDTLVEQPVVAAWVTASHSRIRETAQQQNLPIIPHRLMPDVRETFWVNIIGRGYPAPRKMFRWCTSRMKIDPSNRFIRNVVRASGEAVVVLGTRKAESQQRARTMVRHGAKRLRRHLTPNANLANSLIYTPIEEWTNDDVWIFLMQVKNPWGHTNKSLLSMYRGASPDGECPLVVDTSTPSCGNSRFGCWVCTVVDKDRSMEAMIKNDDEKIWMTPLLELRNELGDFAQDRTRRDYRRMDGRVQLFHDSNVPGPYKKKWREHWLRRVLEAQQEVRRLGPPEVQDLELISMEELREIRRLWLYEKHQFDDSVPVIYEEVTGKPFPEPPSDDSLLRRDDWDILRKLCGEDDEFFELQTQLLDIEREYRGMTRRAGIFDALEDRLRAYQYGGEQAAIAIRQDQESRRSKARGEEDTGGPESQRTLFSITDSDATASSLNLS